MTLLLSMSLVAAVPAQEVPTFKVDVNVVNLFATVRDPNGRIVTDLKQEDFVLEEDGKPQPIRYFARQADLPLTIGILVDTSLSQRRLIDEVLQPQTGRKAIILISDGVDHGSKVSRSRAIEAAQRADSIVYSVRYYDEGAYPSRGGREGVDARGEEALEVLSTETGGRLFEVGKKRPLDKIFQEIQEELRNQYSIGYKPSEEAATGYRKIQLRAKNGQLKVYARSGYYSER